MMMRARFAIFCLTAFWTSLSCFAQQPRPSLTLRLLPTPDLAIQAKLFARLAEFGESRREAIEAGVRLEDVVRRKCGFLTAPLLAVVAKANPGVAFDATNKERAFELPPCPYWQFDASVDIASVQTVSRLANQRMGFAGQRTIDQVAAINPGVVDANGRITASTGKILLPYDSRSFTLVLRRGAGTPASVAVAIQREFPTLLKPKFVDNGQASFVLDRIMPSDGEDACAGKAPPWPFDPDEIDRVLAFNAQHPNDDRGRAIVLIVDSGLNESESIGLPLWENRGEMRARRRPGADNDGNGYVDDLHGANMNNDAGFPAALAKEQYEDADHGTQVASIFAGVWLGERLGKIVRDKVRLAMVNVVDAQVVGMEDDGAPRILVGIPASGVERAYGYAEHMLPSANVVNISLKSDSPLTTIKDYLVNSKYLSVVAAGNDHSQIDDPNNKRYPAEFRREFQSRMLVVAAYDGKGEIPSFSNYGRKIVDIAAPGCAVPATSFGGERRSSTGTSVATPLVSLTGALLYSEGILHPTEIRNRILASSDFDRSLKAKVYSSGRLNTAKALRIYQDVIVPDAEDGKPGKALYGDISDPDKIVLCPENVALNDTLKVIPRYQEGANPALVLRRLGQLTGDYMFCSIAEGAILRFTEEGSTEPKPYMISNLHEIVPRVR